MFNPNFGYFPHNLLIATHRTERFADALIHGNWVLNSFFDGIQSLGSTVLAYAESAFKEAQTLQVDRIAGGGAIAAGFDNKLSFDQGLAVYDNVRTKLAGIAAELPGVTSEYTKAAALLGDDIASALNNGRRSAEQLKQAFESKMPEIIKNLVLNSKLYGQDIPLSAVTRSFTKLLDTGRINNREIFFQRNPLLKASIEKYEKANGRLYTMSKDRRVDALNQIFASTFTKAQLDLLQNAFSTKIEALRSAVIDPDVGLLGFNRKIKGSDGQDTTFFSVLAKAADPFIEALTEAAKLLTQFGDPMQALAGLVETFVSPKIKEFSLNISRGFDEGVNFKGSLAEKIRAGVLSAFSVDINLIDFGAEITKFFDMVANTIRNFGKNGNFTNNPKLDAAINAFVNGVLNVISAIGERITAEFMKNPAQFIKFAFFFNPAAVTQFGLLILALVPVLSALGGVLWSVATFIGVAFLSVFGAPALAFIGLIAGVIIFRQQIGEFANWAKNYTGAFSGVINFIGIVLGLGKSAADAFVDAWNKLMAGDWGGAFLSLLEGIAKSVGAGLYAVLLPFVALVDLLGNTLKGLGSAAGKALEGTANWAGGLLSSAGDTIAKAFQTYVIDPIAGLVQKIPGVSQIQQFNNSTGGLAGQAVNPLNYGLPGSVNRLWQWGSKAITGNAEGNIMGSLLTGFLNEQAMMPQGAEVVFANSSEAIIPRPMYQQFTTGGSQTKTNSINLTVNNYAGEDITQKVMSALENLLNG